MTETLESAAPDKPGFGMGARSLFGGIAWLFKTPAAWPLAMVPVVIAMVITIALGWMSFRFVPGWVGGAIGGTGALAKIGAGLLKVLATALAVVLSSLVAFALAQPLSGAALEGLVRKQEATLGLPERPPTNFFVDIVRSLQSLVIGYGIGLPMILMLFGLGLIVPFASVVLFPVKLLVAASAIAWDICDYPMTVRGAQIGDRVALLMRNKSAVAGFAGGLALLGLIPCALFLFLPAGVAGATQLIHAIERYEEAQGRAPLGGAAGDEPPPALSA